MPRGSAARRPPPPPHRHPTHTDMRAHTHTLPSPPTQASPFSLFLAEELTPLTPSAPVALAGGPGAPPGGYADAALASLGGLASPLGPTLGLHGLADG